MSPDFLEKRVHNKESFETIETEKKQNIIQKTKKNIKDTISFVFQPHQHAIKQKEEFDEYKKRIEKKLRITTSCLEGERKHKELLEAIINEAPITIFTRDGNGMFLSINDTYEKLAGHRKEEIEGTDGEIHLGKYTKERRLRFRQNLQTIFSGEEIVGDPQEYTNKDGEKFLIETTKKRIAIPGEKDQFILAGYGQDVTVRESYKKKLEEKIKALEVALEKLNEITEALESANEELETNNEELKGHQEYLITSTERAKQDAENNKKLSETLEQINEELKELHTNLRKNMGSLIHDIIGPIGGIYSFIEIIEKKIQENKPIGSILSTLKEGSKSALDLIKLYKLYISYIELGQTQELPDHFYSLGDLSSFFETSGANAYIQKEERKRSDVQIILPEITDSLQKTDLYAPRGVIQSAILNNLITNAIKFTPNGGTITVNFSYEMKDEVPELMFSVQDTGSGIKPEDQERIFGSGEQTEAGKLAQGRGFGLANSKQLIDIIGGKIWVESEVGKGSTFSFTIPCKEAPKK